MFLADLRAKSSTGRDVYIARGYAYPVNDSIVSDEVSEFAL